MDTHEQIRTLLDAVPPPTPGDIDDVLARARRRRTQRVVASSSAVLAAVAVLAFSAQALSGSPVPEISPIGTDGSEAIIIVCDGLQCPAASDEQVATLLADLEQDPNVLRARLETPEQTLRRFADELDHLRDIGTPRDGDNPPQTILVEVRDLIALQDTYLDGPATDRIVGPDGTPSALPIDQLVAALTEDNEDLDPDTLEIHHTHIIDESMVVVAEADTSAERRERHEELGLAGTPPTRVGLLIVWVLDPDGAWSWVPRESSSTPITDDGWAATKRLPSGQHILGWGSAHPNGTIDLQSRSNLIATYQLDDQPSGLATINTGGDPTITSP